MRYLRVHGDAREPTCAAAPCCFGHQADAGQVADLIGVELEDLLFAAHPIIQDAQLPATDGGEDVAQPVVGADLRVLVVRRGIARLGGELAGVVNQRFVGRDQHAAAGGGDDLVAVEGEDQ